MVISLTGASSSFSLSAWNTIWKRSSAMTSEGDLTVNSRTVDVPSSTTFSATNVPPGKAKPASSSSAALRMVTRILSSSLPLFWNWKEILISSPSCMVRVLLSEISKSTMPKVAMLRSPLTEALEVSASGQSNMPTLVTVATSVKS